MPPSSPYDATKHPERCPIWKPPSVVALVAKAGSASILLVMIFCEDGREDKVHAVSALTSSSPFAQRLLLLLLLLTFCRESIIIATSSRPKLRASSKSVFLTNLKSG